MEKLPLTLTEAQARKLVSKKGTVQLKHSQLMHPHMHYLLLHSEAHKRAKKAMNSGKGLRIGPLTDEEINGSGFFDLLKNIGRAAVKAGKFVKDNIIDSNLYQTSIKPEVRKLVDSGEAAISGILPPSVANVSKTLIDALGNKTGAYGLITIPSEPKAKPKARPKAGPKAGPKAKPKAKPKAGPKAKPKAGPKAVEGGSFVIG
jgi:hypothetical protein